MKALTIRQPWASLISLGVKRIETRSWRAPKALIGQTIAIHAGASSVSVMAILKAVALDLDADAAAICNALLHHEMEPIDLPLGAIVTTATLADCLPMVDGYSMPVLSVRQTPYDFGHEGRFIEVTDERLTYWWHHDAGFRDITDQLPYGDFAPGRWAWMLTDVQPCEPTAAKGKQGLWEWQPGFPAKPNTKGMDL